MFSKSKKRDKKKWETTTHLYLHLVATVCPFSHMHWEFHSCVCVRDVFLVDGFSALWPLSIMEMLSKYWYSYLEKHNVGQVQMLPLIHRNFQSIFNYDYLTRGVLQKKKQIRRCRRGWIKSPQQMRMTQKTSTECLFSTHANKLTQLVNLKERIYFEKKNGKQKFD